MPGLISVETWLGCTMEEVTDMLEAHFDEHRCAERQARVGGWPCLVMQ